MPPTRSESTGDGNAKANWIVCCRLYSPGRHS